MFLLLTQLLWADSDIEVGIYAIEGTGHVQLRKRLEEKLYEGLLLTTAGKPYWIVSSKQQRERLENLEEEIDCIENCALSISKAVGLERAIVGSFETKEGEDGNTLYRLSLHLHTISESAKTTELIFEETQPLALQSKMKEAAEILLFPQEEPMAEKSRIDDESEKTTSVGTTSDTPQETPTVPSMYQLSVESQPQGAIVLVDGELFCRETPCSYTVLEGKHLISVQYEEHDTFEKEITLVDDFSLDAVLGPSFAELSIAGQNSSQVYIDGSLAKKLPIFSQRISEGSHIVTVNDPCFLREDHTVDLSRGEKYTVELKQNARTVPIDINVQDSFSTDYEAVLLIDGREVGTSPFSGKVPLCSKELEIRLQRGEDILTKSHELTLNSKANAVIISVPDSLEVGKRSVPFDWSFLIDEPIWFGGIGFRDGTHSATDSARFLLSSGYIQPIAGGDGIYEYSLPSDMFLEETEIGGLGITVGMNNNHLFGRFDIDYGLSGALYYYAPEANGFPLMVYSPDILNFSLSAGFMPMIPFFRPFLGGRVQAGVFTMDILEVGTESEFLSTYPLDPYYLVATDFNEDGEPIRPKLQMGHAAAGLVAGGLLYFPGNDFILGLEMMYSYMFSTAGSSQQVDTTLVFGNRF